MKKLYILLAVAFASLAMTSCFDDPGNEVFFDGNIVEFHDGNLPNGLTTTQVRRTLTQTDVINIQVDRTSTSAASAVTVNFDVDPSSTAVSGVHYDLPTKTVTIPAGEFVATFPITILTGNIDPSEAPVLKLNMTSATGADISPNYGDLAINIKVICPSDLAGTWKFENGNTTDIVQIGTGNYRIENLNAMGGYYLSTFVIEGYFTDNCNVVTLYGKSAYNVEWRGTGVFDPATETITWESIEDTAFGNGFKREQVVMTRQ